MNSNSLRYVVAVADEKNFTRAAQKLFISQPSLSQSIQTLERQLGVTLFDRSKPNLELTYAGTLYVEWARQILYSETLITARMMDLAEKKTNNFTLGTSPHRVLYLLPPVIEEFYSAFPNCRIILEDKPTNELYELMAKKYMDLVIDVPHPDELQYSNILLAEEQILLAVPDTCELAAEHKAGDAFDSVELAQAKDCRFILQNQDRMLGNIARSLCQKAGFLPDVYIECCNAETAHAMASRGVGITFVQELNVKLKGPMPHLHYYYIKPLMPSRRLAAIYRKDQGLSEEAKYMIGLLTALLA